MPAECTGYCSGAGTGQFDDCISNSPFHDLQLYNHQVQTLNSLEILRNLVDQDVSEELYCRNQCHYGPPDISGLTISSWRLKHLHKHGLSDVTWDFGWHGLWKWSRIRVLFASLSLSAYYDLYRTMPLSLASGATEWAWSLESRPGQAPAQPATSRPTAPHSAQRLNRSHQKTH